MHPFALNIYELESLDLDFVENLNQDDATNLGGGAISDGRIITKALYEGGGWYPPSDRYPTHPLPTSNSPINQLPTYTTLALGEEGGGYYDSL